MGRYVSLIALQCCLLFVKRITHTTILDPDNRKAIEGVHPKDRVTDSAFPLVLLLVTGQQQLVSQLNWRIGKSWRAPMRCLLL